MVNDLAIDGIQRQFHVKLDAKNIKFPKMKYKGTPTPTVIRSEKKDAVKVERDAYDILSKFPYPYESMSSAEKAKVILLNFLVLSSWITCYVMHNNSLITCHVMYNNFYCDVLLLYILTLSPCSIGTQTAPGDDSDHISSSHPFSSCFLNLTGEFAD